MKIAYIIVAHDKPKHLLNLINALDNPNVSFYVHIDKKCDINDFNIPRSDNIHLYQDRKSINWGGADLVMLELEMLKMAVKGNFNYYVFISGTDYPIKSNKYIINIFTKNKGNNFINIWKMPLRGKTFDRIDYYYFSYEPKSYKVKDLIFRTFNFLIRKLNLKRKYPKKYRNLVLYGGSSWWALTDGCVKYILEYSNSNPKLINFYKNTFIPDEMLIQTIIGNSPYKSKIMPSPTYTFWKSNSPHPETINDQIIDEIFDKNNHEKYLDFLFTRKFGNESEKLTNRINTYLSN